MLRHGWVIFSSSKNHCVVGGGGILSSIIVLSKIKESVTGYYSANGDTTLYRISQNSGMVSVIEELRLENSFALFVLTLPIFLFHC